jgi:ATP-dependent helicase Lhr and Lhr-like helicase
MESEALSVLGPVARQWFEREFGLPTPAQELAWPALADGRSALVVAPTGSGKTLAAFLVFLDKLAREPREAEGVRVLYISPLRALGNDIHRNLDVPLAGMRELDPNVQITTGLRTGDTTQRDRNRLLRHPPDVLITTPESLFLMLTSENAAKTLESVETVIVDEVHNLAESKRGTHLVLSLERLRHLTGRPFQRVGLSATVRPADKVARWLAGHENGTPREMVVLDAGGRKEMDLTVESPVDDFRELPGESVWPSIFDRLLELINEHTSTLIFVNDRAKAERVAAQVNARAGETIVRTHHGSISREARLEVEELLKRGELPALVATSSLELGIDIGAIDLVVQLESPKTATAGLQRVGRSGHLVGETATGVIVPKYRPDLLDAAVVASKMLRREIEHVHIPEGCLDVLAQQLAGTVCTGTGWTAERLLELVRRADPYRNLGRDRFNGVLSMLAGRYPAARFGELAPRVVWNRESGEVTPRPGTRMLVLMNAGAIPERGLYSVVHAMTGAKLGSLDEEFVFESRPGDSFVLGTTVWRIETMDRDRVVVTEAPGSLPRIPFWNGDLPGRPHELGLAFGEFLREASEQLDEPEFVDWVRDRCALDSNSALNLRTYLLELREALGELPNDRLIVVEDFLDELGDHRIVVHSPFGRRVHHAWLLAARARIRDAMNLEVEALAHDDGFMLRFPAGTDDPPFDLITQLPGEEELDELLIRELQISPLFGALFRENAARALLLPRRGPERRTPLWLLRIRSQDLMQVVKRFGDFPVLLETYREAWDDLLRVPDVHKVARAMAAGDIAVKRTTSEIPSPFASSLMFEFTGAMLYGGDQPRAEWRTQLLAIDRETLSTLIRPEEMRGLIDRRAVSGLEAVLQRMAEKSRPRSPDELADALAHLGDLSAAELRDRAGPDWRTLADALVADGRALVARVGDEQRYIASEYADEYARPHVPAAIRSVIRRWMAAKGPVTPDEVADRYGITRDDAAARLQELQALGEVVAGEFLPGGTEREFVDAQNLRRIHQDTLRILRKQIEPVDPERYAAFLVSWHQLDRGAGSERRARPSLDRLAGAPVPAAALERGVLERRADPKAFDELIGGEFVWQGLPGRRVALLPRADAPALLRPAQEIGENPVLDALRDRGALFLSELAMATELSERDVLDRLFPLVWAGLVTNDSLAGIREPQTPKRGQSRSERLASAQLPRYGRWSLLPDRDADRAAGAWADRLLQLYGVVAREMAAAIECPVPWPLLRDRLGDLEAAGRVRRGYFVRGLSGIQYALPEAVERLRRKPTERAVLIAAADPANAYGGLLPLPADKPYRVHRVPGAWLVLKAGRPLLAVEGGGRKLHRLSHDDITDAVKLVEQLAETAPRGRLTIEEWDGMPVVATEGADLLAAAGFSRGPRQMSYRRPL